MLIDGALVDAARKAFSDFDPSRCGRMSYDVSLHHIFSIPNTNIDDLLFLESRGEADFTEKSMSFIRGEPQVAIMPGSFMLARLKEHMHMPDHLVGVFSLRSQYARLGLNQATSIFIRPGWQGYLVLELYNHLHRPIVLREGEVIGQVSFIPGISICNEI